MLSRYRLFFSKARGSVRPFAFGVLDCLLESDSSSVETIGVSKRADVFSFGCWEVSRRSMSETATVFLVGRLQSQQWTTQRSNNWATYGTGLFLGDKITALFTISISSVGESTTTLLAAWSLTALWNVHTMQQMSDTEHTLKRQKKGKGLHMWRGELFPY